MSQFDDLNLAMKNRTKMNDDFAKFEVTVSRQAEYEHHSEITGITNDGRWISSVPGGGTITNVRNHSNSALGVGAPVHLSKNTGVSSVNQKITSPSVGFTNAGGGETINAPIV